MHTSISVAVCTTIEEDLWNNGLAMGTMVVCWKEGNLYTHSPPRGS